MSIAQVAKHDPSDKLGAPADLPLHVTVKFDGVSIIAHPLKRHVPKRFKGQIIWTIDGDYEFDPDGIVFADPSITTVRGADNRTYSATVSNEPNQNGLQFPYTISVKGLKREDPVVQNDPPPDDVDGRH
jgi:hypothetical protein